MCQGVDDWVTIGRRVVRLSSIVYFSTSKDEHGYYIFNLSDQTRIRVREEGYKELLRRLGLEN